MTTSGTEALHRIVIVGGGAGGLELATRLGDSLGKRKRAKIILVDTTLTHLWKPLLHEVAAGTLNSYEDELSYLAQGRWHGFTFRLGKVSSIDRDHKTISTLPVTDERGNEYIPARSFSYDTLILAVGSVSNDFGISGVREYCRFIDNRTEADQFHQSLLKSHYTANTQDEPVRPGQLHIAIAGAGATGVELAAELHHSTRELIEYGLDRIDAARHLKITIIEAADRVLAGLPPKLSAQVQDHLQEIGIEVMTGERIVEATADGFSTDGGSFIPAEIKVWAAGIRAPEFLSSIAGLETNEKHQLLVTQALQTTRDEDIFAFGDCAACPMPGGGTVPPRAQAAHQQAALLAKTMRARLDHRPLPVFRYVDYGSLITMSRYSTVGNLMGNIMRLWSPRVFIEGTMARLVYLSLYKMHQVTLHGFIRTSLLTVANILTRRTRPRMKLH